MESGEIKLPGEPLATLAPALRELDKMLLSAVVGGGSDPDPLASLRITQADVVELLDTEAESPWSRDAADTLPQECVEWFPRALAERCGLTPFDRCALLLAAAPEFDPKYERIFAFLQDNVNARRPTPDLAYRLFGSGFSSRLKIAARFLPGSPLRRCGVMTIADSMTGLPALAGSEMRANDAVLGILDPAPEGSGFPLPVGCAWVAAPKEPYGAGLPSLGTLTSYNWVSGVGHGFLEEVLAALRTLSDGVIRVAQANMLDRAEPARFKALCETLLRAAHAEAGVAIVQFETQPHSDESKFIRRTCERARLLGVPVTVLSPRAPDAALCRSAQLQEVAIDLPVRENRCRNWSRLLLGVDVDPPTPEGVCERLAALLPLLPAQISAVVRRARTRSFDDLARGALDEYRSPSLLGSHVPLRCRAQGLLLPRPTQGRVAELCEQVSVHERMRTRSSLTGGLVALLTGRSGTGKTLAAEAIAFETGYDLFRVSASRINDKYVGETEKNIDRVFELVEGRGSGRLSSKTILLIDEAEWLFGERVRGGGDAQSHYITLQVGHMLQRLEAYQGVAILTCNLPENLDDAFRRRWFHCISFPMPGPQLRVELWRRMLGACRADSTEVDVPGLAEAYPLSGGSIRNVALLAAYNAEAASSPITTSMLREAVSREYEKLGHVVDTNLGGSVPADRAEERASA